jgi:hypothetical protein
MNNTLLKSSNETITSENEAKRSLYTVEMKKENTETKLNSKRGLKDMAQIMASISISDSENTIQKAAFVVDDTKDTPLHTLLRNNSDSNASCSHNIKLLSTFINTPNSNQKTPVHVALANQNYPDARQRMIQSLIQNGANLTYSSASDPCYLFTAFSNGYFDDELIKSYFEQGGNALVQDNFGNNLLIAYLEFLLLPHPENCILQSVEVKNMVQAGHFYNKNDRYFYNEKTAKTFTLSLMKFTCFRCEDVWDIKRSIVCCEGFKILCTEFVKQGGDFTDTDSRGLNTVEFIIKILREFKIRPPDSLTGTVYETIWPHFVNGLYPVISNIENFWLVLDILLLLQRAPSSKKLFSVFYNSIFQKWA